MTVQQLGKNLTSLTHYAPDGIEMGVMSDGTPYLGARGLATLCGTAASNIITLIKDWDTLKHNPRGLKIIQLIEAQGGRAVGLYVPLNVNGVNYHAINDINCMAILEYYAFESQAPSEIARNNYRSLARLSLRTFIYEKTGYDPSNLMPDYWRIFHERMTLNEVPSGFFSVFEEMASLLVTSIRNGMPFDNKTMPDISVGQHWGRIWNDSNYDEQIGKRIKHQHIFPKDFPQKNPEAWIYPVEALGAFRKWFDDSYLRSKFPAYLATKAKRGALPDIEIKALIAAVQPSRLEN